MEKLLKQLKNINIPKSWRRNGSYANDTLPDKEIVFLTRDHMEKVKRHIRLTETNVDAIHDTIAIIREDKNLRSLAWLWHCILFRKQDYVDEDVSLWPSPSKLLDIPEGVSALFPAVIILSGYDHALSAYQNIGPISENVIGDTLSSVEICMSIHLQEQGIPGLSMTHMKRLLHHLNGDMFVVGRLEFHMNTFGKYLRAYRNGSTGEVIALCENGIRYRSDGHVEGTNAIYDETESWLSTLMETNSQIKGQVIRETGYASKQQVRLNKKEWSLALSEGDDVLNVHIPRGTRLTIESVQDSLKQATNFFKTHFPNKQFRAFVCISWMLDPQLQELLDESSNLVQFQRGFHLFPTLSDDRSLYQFVFPCDPQTPAHLLPESTSLQKKIKNYMIDGGRLHTGGGFILIEGESFHESTD